MKTLKTLGFLFLAFSALALSVQVMKTEAYVQLWETRVASVEQREKDVATMLECQDYSNRVVEAVRMLAVENGLLCERDAKMQKYVLAMEEENAKLKAALDQSVEKMSELLEENSELMSEVQNLKWQISILEDTVETLKDRGPTLDDIKESILELFTKGHDDV